MSGETSNLSQPYKFQLIIFDDETAAFPDDVLKLDYYLGPSLDLGPAMTVKILTPNGQMLHRSTYELLTPHKILDKDGSNAWE